MATSTGPAPIQPVRSGINLLDNWYFVGGGSQQGGRQFPINQRGQTSYTNNTYAIDRWNITAGALFTLEPTYCRFDAGNANRYISQVIDTKGILKGKKVTLSLLLSSGLASGTGVIPEPPSSNYVQIIKITYQIPNGRASGLMLGSDGILFFQFGVAAGNSMDIIAAKLELGDTQTLAHQENGIWVLNDPPPNYNMELLKCQLSTADSSDTYANKKVQFVTT